MSSSLADYTANITTICKTYNDTRVNNTVPPGRHRRMHQILACDPSASVLTTFLLLSPDSDSINGSVSKLYTLLKQGGGSLFACPLPSGGSGGLGWINATTDATWLPTTVAASGSIPCNTPWAARVISSVSELQPGGQVRGRRWA